MTSPFEPVAEPVQTTSGLLEDDFLLPSVDLPSPPAIQWTSQEPVDLSHIETLYIGVYGIFPVISFDFY